MKIHPDEASSAGAASTAVSSAAPAARNRSALHPKAAWRSMVRTSAAPYRRAGSFAFHFAEGKLSRDPVFRHLLERGYLSGRHRVLDIGCGQGLLSSLLAATEQAAREGRWPDAWPAAPSGVSYTGIELMQRDVSRAESSLAGLPGERRFIRGDMCEATLPRSDAVVILDVLHYVPHAAQDALLQRVRDALSPGGRLLLRIGDMSARGGFAASQWVDRVVTLVRGHRVPPTFGRPLDDWIACLGHLGFKTHAVPMSQGTPFANVLLVGELPSAPNAVDAGDARTTQVARNGDAHSTPHSTPPRMPQRTPA